MRMLLYCLFRNKQGYDLYKNGSTQNQYIDAHFIPRLSVDCENHEETEIGEFILFVELKKKVMNI